MSNKSIPFCSNVAKMTRSPTKGQVVMTGSAYVKSNFESTKQGFFLSLSKLSAAIK
jgi:hypothetical protein